MKLNPNLVNMNIKILFVEDSREDYDLAIEALTNSDFEFEPKLAIEPKEYQRLLIEFNPDIIISDNILQNFNGIEVLDIKNKFNPQIPFIIFTGLMNEKIALEWMRLGVNDYVLKEHVKRLALSIITSIEISKIKAQKTIAENSLIESEARFRILTESTTSAIFINQEYFIYANRAAQELTGFSLDEIIKMKFWEFVHPDFQRLAKERDIARRNRKDILNRYEMKIIRKDKHERWIDLTAATINYAGTNSVIVTAFDITERKLDEITLRESEERYRDSFENAVIGKTIINAQGKFLKVNKSFTKLIEYSENELLEMNFGDITHPDDLIKSWNSGNLLISGKETNVSFEKRYIKKGGDIVWVIISFFVHTKVKDKPFSFASDIIDITERKYAVEELRKLTRAVEQSPNSVIITNVEGNIEYINPTFTKVTGYLFEELKGKNPRIFQSGLTSKETYKSMWLTITSGEIWQGEIQNKKKNGDIFWESMTISGIKDNNGIITHFLAVKENISEKKHANEEILKSEAQFRSVWDKSFDALRLTNEEGIILLVNDAYCRITGKSKEELEGKYYDVVYIRENRHSIEKFRNDFKQKKIRSNYESEVKFWDGRISWLEISNSFIGVEHQSTKLLSIFRDISGRKKTEQELISAKEKAEEVSRIKSNFLASMSHELRTPMIGILGFAEILKMELEIDIYKDMAETIHQSGQRLLRTLNQILDLSRIESNKLDIKIQPIQIIPIILENIKQYKVLAFNKGIQVLENFIKTNVTTLIDERYFIQVLDNLLDNAVKYTQQGEIIIQVDEENLNGKGWAILKVIDTGIGISLENQQIIFEEFRQASEGLGRNYEGTGLGLAITKKSVELMGGTIEVESQLEKGSTFIVKLPLANNFNIGNNNIHSSGTKNSSSKQKILFVENDQFSQDFVKLSLKNLFDVDIAESGEEALKKIKEYSYNIILMDIGLGKGMDGIMATKEIRKVNPYQNIPIIAVTAFAMKGDKEKILSEGLNDYISKPFTRKEIIDLISKNLAD